MTPTVLLFDIDGTLVTTGGVGRRAIERTFEQEFGRADACEQIRFGGMTDRAIFREALTAIGQPADPESVERLIARYVERLEEEIVAADMTRYRIHAGIEAALDAVAARPNTAIGLGTGNVRGGARAKLAHVGLFHRFAFGGFGCDAEDRGELIRTGAERGAASLGVPLNQCRVVIVGDTPKDVAAAQAIGAESLGVETGGFARGVLAECGATRAVENLAEAGAVAFLLG